MALMGWLERIRLDVRRIQAEQDDRELILAIIRLEDRLGFNHAHPKQLQPIVKG